MALPVCLPDMADSAIWTPRRRTVLRGRGCCVPSEPLDRRRENCPSGHSSVTHSAGGPKTSIGELGDAAVSRHCAVSFYRLRVPRRVLTELAKYEVNRREATWRGEVRGT